MNSPKGSFRLFRIGEHMAFDHHLGIGRHHKIFPKSFRRRESKRRSHNGADFGVIVNAEWRNV